MAERRKPVKAWEGYKPKKYETVQIPVADEVVSLDNELFLSGAFDKLLSRWVFTNKVIPTILIPTRYEPKRKRYEILKTDTITEGGALRVAIAGAGFSLLERKTGKASAIPTRLPPFEIDPLRVIIKSLDYPFMVRFSLDGMGWTDPNMIRGEETEIFDICGKYIAHKRAGGTDASFEIVALR